MLAVLCTASMALPARAQTVAPVVARYVEEGRGELTVENPTADPVPVSVTARGFTVDSTGTVHFTPIPDGTRVELAYRSFTLPPFSRTVVPYRVRAAALPAWVVIETSFLPPRRGAVQTRIVLPHVVYVRQRAVLDVADLSGSLVPGDSGWTLRLTNDGPALDRVTGLAWLDADGRTITELAQAAPVLPHTVRRLTLGDAPHDARAVRVHGEFGALVVPLPNAVVASTPHR